jgi:DNA-nicking Smr family endonuclease
MSGRGRRTLAPEEAALWQRVIATVTPLEKRKPKALVDASASTAPRPETLAGKSPEKASPSAEARMAASARAARAEPTRLPVRSEESPNTLDGSWDRKLSRGLVAPESAIDLHGHSLASAYDRLDAGLEQAIRQGDRVLLLITGKAPRPESERPHARGAIRAAVGDWLKASRHADRIAAVRRAHPRHGGSGALYIVLRRTKAPAGRIS